MVGEGWVHSLVGELGGVDVSRVSAVETRCQRGYGTVEDELAVIVAAVLACVLGDWPSTRYATSYNPFAG